MLNGKSIRILGLVAAVVSAGSVLLTDWVSEKRMEKMIDEKVDKRLTEKDDDEES